MDKGVIIIGGAAGAKIAYEILELRGISVIGFLDNYLPENRWGRIKANVLGSIEDRKNKELLMSLDVDYFVATGDNKLRMNIIEKLVSMLNKTPINVIHPSAILSENITMGYGNLICANAVINIDAQIGNGVIINTSSVIEHDNVIEDYAQISPNAALAGYVTIKKGAFIATGASVIPRVIVGEFSYVAAGAVVTKNVEKNTLVAGVPARFIKYI